MDDARPTRPVHRSAQQDFRWDGVDLLPYKEDERALFKAITRQTLFSDPDLDGEGWEVSTLHSDTYYSPPIATAVTLLQEHFVRAVIDALHDLNNIQYGYLWWNIEYPYKDRKLRAYFAGGNGGQLVLVVPDLDLVVATYGGNYADRVSFVLQQEYVPQYILPAVREAGDDPTTPVQTKDFKTPYGRPPPK